MSPRNDEPTLINWRHAIGESELDATATAVAFAIDAYMNADGEAWPSREAIARYVKRSVRTVERTIRRIEEAGLLLVERSKGRRPNRYFALINGDRATAVRRNSVTRDSQRRQTGHPTASPVTPEIEGNRREITDERRSRTRRELDPSEYASLDGLLGEIDGADEQKARLRREIEEMITERSLSAAELDAARERLIKNRTWTKITDEVNYVRQLLLRHLEARDEREAA